MKRLSVIALVITGCCGPVAAPALSGCRTYGRTEPTRVSTNVKADVRVAVDTCVENREAVLNSGDYATLECSEGGSGAIIRIFFPRKQWQSMKQDGIGIVDAGPGK